MNRCETTRDLLLDHLYGALDDGDAEAVRDHLAACDDCRGALERERAHARILADAAKVAAGDWTPPARVAPPPFFTWMRIAAAAALVVVGAGVAVGYRSHARARAIEENPRVSILAPRTVSPGEPAEFFVDVATVDGDPVAAEVRVDLAGDGTAASKTAPTDAAGKARLVFDPGVGRPGEQLRAAFSVVLPGGRERRASTVVVRDATRFLARASTDKPLYRPGETVRVRALVLDRFRLTPGGDLWLRAQVMDPRGAPVADTRIPTVSGVGGWAWEIPAGISGGEYRLVLSDASGSMESFPQTDRKFVVRSYRVPRIKGEIEFDRDSYGPGDRGEAWISAERAEGGVPAGATLEASVAVDGAEVSRETVALPGTGRTTVAFTLPTAIEEGRGTLTVIVRDGGSVETLAKTVPISLDRLDVAFFPEGGDLVAGLRSRVYFRVRDSKDEPADLDADLVDSRGRKVADARVEVLGMGRVEFRPEAGESYRLVAHRPAGVTIRGEFPKVVPSGVTLRALDEVATPRSPIRVEVASTGGGLHSLVAYCRGVLVAQEMVDLEAGEPRVVELRPGAEVGGVFRVTVLDAAGVPCAERLVSVAPPRRVDLEVRPSGTAFAPGERVKVGVRARDEAGRPARAVLGVAVVDGAVVSLANDEDTPDLPTHFLLGLEVEELEKVDRFAGGPEASAAVDLLLGVQGWRRFAWREPADFLAKNPETGPRVVLASAADAPQRADNFAAVRAATLRQTARVDRRLSGVATFGALALVFVLGFAALVSGMRWKSSPRVFAGFGAAGLALVIAMGVVSDRVHAPRDAMLHIARAPAGANEMEFPRFDVPGTARGFDGDLALGALYRWQAGPMTPAALRALGYLAVGHAMDREPAPQVEWRWAGAASPEAGGVDRNPFEMALRFERNEEVADPLDFRQAIGPGTPGIWAHRDVADKKTQFSVLTREYAHRRKLSPDGTRKDFAEVLYWNPSLVTGDDGNAAFEFDTSDSVTTFAVGVEASDARGALATTEASIRNRLPFFLEPKLPEALSAGDRLFLPVVVGNETGAPLEVRVDLETGGDLLRPTGGPTRTTTVAPGDRGRVLFDLVAQPGAGTASLTLAGRAAEGIADRSIRTIPVAPRGFPREIARGGMLEKRDAVTLRLPDDLDRSTLAGSLRLYPSVLSTLADGLDAMLQEPNGCFEQASSTNYPNVLVLTYLSEQADAAPELARKAKDLLARGYARLTGYECRQRGYEWFGGDPGHEALTAYGLMEFADMAKVHAVDAAMIGRTREWLLARRDGKGGFQRNDRALDSFGRAPAEVTDAYIAWAVTEADAAADLGRELGALEERARASEDPYFVALVANALANRKASGAESLLGRLAAMQREDGGFAGKKTSITSSTGPNLEVETTALAAMAFATDPARLPNGERAVRFLVERRRAGGSFGATQATILALRALVEHARVSRRTACDHDLAITVNGKTVATRQVPAGTPGVVAFEREFLDALVPGENRIEMTTGGAEALPWAIGVRYHATLPPSDEDCAVGLSTTLDRAVADEGESVRATVALRNLRDEGIPMTLVRLGLPAGLEPRAERLKEMKEQGEVDFYETRPREVTLYFRGLAPGAEKRLAIDLVAAIPGEFEGPASSAYLYYSDDRKRWAAPLKARIEPAKK